MDKMSQLIKFINHSQSLNPQTIDNFLRRLAFAEEDIRPWKVLEEKLNKSQKTIIHQANTYEIVLVSWKTGEFSSIHVHDKVQWGVIQIFGQAEYALYKTHDGVLTVEQAIKKELCNGDVIQVLPDTIHQLGNSSSKPFYSLHVYGNDEVFDDLTYSAQNFYLEEDRLVPISDGEFI